MKKQELEGLCALKATPKMMQMAANDTPRQEKKYGREQDVYERGLYMRCRIQNGILKVAFFLAENMRAGGRNSVYELFIDNVSKQFLTYDVLHNKWRTAKLDRIDLPSYFYHSKQKWISQSDNVLIKKYLGIQHDGYEGLLEYQRQIRNDQLKQRHKKETDPWDSHLAQVPKLPKDWERWVDKVGIPQNYIFYKYSSNGADIRYPAMRG